MINIPLLRLVSIGRRRNESNARIAGLVWFDL